MGKIILSLIFAVFNFMQAYASSGLDVSSVNNISSRVDILEYKVPLLVEEKLNDQLASVNAIVSTGIAQQGIILTLFSVLFGLFLIIIGWFINDRLNQIKELNKTINQSSQDIINLSNNIKNTPEIFYYKLQDIENDYIFERLEKVDTRDVSNFFTVLTTRNLDSKYADRLINLYEKSNGSYAEKFFQLLVQHFPEKVFLKDILWDKFTASFYEILPQFFDKELIFIAEKISNANQSVTNLSGRFNQFIDICAGISSETRRTLLISQIRKSSKHSKELLDYIDAKTNNQPSSNS